MIAQLVTAQVIFFTCVKEEEVVTEDDGEEEELPPEVLIPGTTLAGRRIDLIKMEGLINLGICQKACSGWSILKAMER